MPERSYRIVLFDGSERTVKARECDIDEGVLSFNDGGRLVLAYASDTWKMVELEGRNDE